MLTIEARVEKVAAMFRKAGLKAMSASVAAREAGREVSGWATVRVPRVGEMQIHVMPLESCKLFGWNEVWARFNGVEYRGSAEKVARELCLLLPPPQTV